MKLIVRRAGFLTTVQDLGRFGFRALGVSLGGALDPFALRMANLLVGNEESLAGLELTFGKVQLQFTDTRTVVWCGGDFEAHKADRRIAAGTPCSVAEGDVVDLQPVSHGCRAWLAISGGIDVPLVLGSRSTDLRAKFGGFEERPLRDGDIVPLGRPTVHARALARRSLQDLAPRISGTDAADGNGWTLRIIRGRDWNRFDGSTHHALTTESFTVTPDSDRMGARLDGPLLRRTDAADLISEPVAPGTLQIPPEGRPILLLRDCQTIGGYPKIAHVITTDLSIAAQLRPGDRVRFQEISLADAHRLLFEREQELDRFRIGRSTSNPI